jgi:hypothetical protein
MAWFARLYSIVLDIRAWATLMVKPFKLQALTAWNRIRDQARTFMARDGGELKRRIARLRDAVRQRPRG